ncbi:MAG: hypothetical protein ACOCZ2_02425 [Thermodesulfobacteriota bacterium]
MEETILHLCIYRQASSGFTAKPAPRSPGIAPVLADSSTANRDPGTCERTR